MRSSRVQKVLAIVLTFVLVFSGNTASMEPLAAWAAGTNDTVSTESASDTAGTGQATDNNQATDDGLNISTSNADATNNQTGSAIDETPGVSANNTNTSTNTGAADAASNNATGDVRTAGDITNNADVLSLGAKALTYQTLDENGAIADESVNATHEDSAYAIDATGIDFTKSGNFALELKAALSEGWLAGDIITVKLPVATFEVDQDLLAEWVASSADVESATAAEADGSMNVTFTLAAGDAFAKKVFLHIPLADIALAEEATNVTVQLGVNQLTVALPAAPTDEEVALFADSAQANAETTSVTATKQWFDNGDSARPDQADGTTTLPMYLYYRNADDPNDTWIKLQAGFVADSLGLTDVPEITVTHSGTNAATYSANGLPTTLTTNGKTYNLAWKIDEDVDSSAANAANKVKGISYARSYAADGTLKNTQLKDATFYIQDLDGGTYTAHDASSFTLYRETSDGSWVEVKQLDKDGNEIDQAATGTFAPTEKADTFALAYANLPKYDENNKEIVYSLVCNNEVPETSSYTQRDDWFAPTYLNSAVANYGTVTDRAHEGGTIQLLRSNMTKMTIHKDWLDNNNAYNTRPSEDNNRTYQLYLWRYVNDGTSTYQDASQVLDGAGYPVGADLPSGLLGGTFSNEDITFWYQYGSDSSTTSYLPKYDAEGNEYIYLARETKPAGDGYEQVFGKISVADDGSEVKEDTLPESVSSRDSLDKSIYNGGTISNRLAGTSSIEGEKGWVAAAHQSYLENYHVTMKLQQSTDNGATWNDAKQNGRTVTQVAEGFSAEIETQDFSASMPAYDPLGRVLKYRWIEDSVSETTGAGSTDCPLQTDDDQGSYTGTPGKDYFTTSKNVNDANGDEGDAMLDRQNRDWYYSQVTTDEETGAISVTNKLEGLIDYKVVKKWYGQKDAATGAQNLEEPTDGTELTLKLYQNGKIYDANGDGKGDSSDYYTMTKAKNGVGGSEANASTTEGEWDYIFTDLPKYDDAGNTYDYYVMEDIPAGYFPSYSFDEDLRTMTISNYPGVEGQVISVAKEWLDDSNTAYRPKATYAVTGTYKEDTETTDASGNKTAHAKGSAFTYTGTLSTANNWWELVDVKGVDMDSIKVTEQKLTDTQGVDYVVAYDAADQVSGTVSTGTDGFDYEVVNPTTHAKVDGYEKYVITNRRVGVVNIEVTKTWLDGQQDESYRPGAKLTLTCMEYPNAVGKSTVTLDSSLADLKDQPIEQGENVGGRVIATAGTSATSVQDVKKSGSASYYFCNLPKYDATGKIVHYQVEESWDDASDAHAKEYTVSYGQGYQLGAERHTNDSQSVAVTNSRSGSKTVSINKTWNDLYQYTRGNRPDIKLTLWQRTHNADGSTSTTLYNGNGFKEYNWGPRAGAASDRQAYELTADFGTLPKYDSLGYEIDYFFQETVPEGAKANYDYNETTYQDDNQADLTEGTAAYDSWVTTEGDTTLLREDGTFVNSISNTVKIEGTKIWKNIPDGFPSEEVPSIKVSVNQTAGDGAVLKGIATTSELSKPEGSDRLTFYLVHTGDNTGVTAETAMPTDGTGLPKYDAKGSLYTYSLTETYTTNQSEAGEWTNVYETNAPEGSYTLENIYNGDTTKRGSIAVTKDWTDRSGYETKDFPVATFTLYRQYQTGAGDWSTTSEKVASKTLNANNGDTKVQFDDLPQYAPNGKAYRYFVVESAINGQKITWTNGETVTLNGSQVAASRYITVAAGDTEYANASNAYVPDEISLTVKKQWNDGNDAAGIRPDSIQVTLSRSADAQQGQKNAIATEELGVTFTLNEAGNWEMTSGETLQKWAPNGMPWKYTVKEVSAPDGYTVSYTNNPASAAGGNATITIKNSYDQNVTFTKTWVDSNNKYGTRPASVKVQLQVAALTQGGLAVGSISADEWSDAADSATLGDSLSSYLCKQFTGSETESAKLITGTSTKVANLPVRAKINGTESYLYYRIVEATQVEDGTTYPVGSVDGPSVSTLKNYEQTDSTATYNAASKTFSSTATNKLLTTSLSINKQWVDYTNAYGIRPSSIKFKLQYSSDAGTTWSDYKVGSNDVTITMTASGNGTEDANTWNRTFEDLPKCSADGTAYRWRVSELIGSAAYENTYDNDAQPEAANQSTAINTLKSFSVALNKKGLNTDGNAADINGVSFDVYFKGQSSKLFTWTRNDSGVVSIAVAKTYQDSNGQTKSLPITVDSATGVVSGLPAGTYILKETKAPAQYVQNKQLEFTIGNGGAVTSGTQNAVSGDEASGYTVSMTDALAKANFTITKVLNNYGSSTSALAGVTFDLYKQGADGTYTKVEGATQTTNASGKATFADLYVGKYFVVETQVPDDVVFNYETGYFFEVTNENDGKVVADTTSTATYTAEVDDAQKQVELKNGNLAVSGNAATIENTPFGAKIKFQKTDATDGSALTGATFELWHKGYGETDYTLVNGKITDPNTDGIYERTGLARGEYQLVETAAPRGYTITPMTGADSEGAALKNNCVAHFTIGVGTDGQIINVNTSAVQAATDEAPAISNARIPGEFTFTKVDSDGVALAGAEFLLEYKQADDSWKTVGTYTTDANGKIAGSNLEWGTYRITETKAPAGYERGDNATATEFAIGANATTVNAVFKNKLCSVQFVKVDEQGNALAGAQFQLTDAAGNVVAGWSSTSDPQKIDYLVEGEQYTLTETARPAGYYALSSAITFTVDNQGKVVMTDDASGAATLNAEGDVMTIANTPVSANLRFTKTELINETCADKTLSGGLDAAATQPLAGAEFTLEAMQLANEDMTFDAQTVTSAEDGTVSFTGLPEGTYKLTETSTPAGHVTAAERTVQVTGEGAVLMGTSDADMTQVDDATAIINDRVRASLSFKKVSELDKTKVLPGAEYELYRLGETADGGIATALADLLAPSENTNEGLLVAKATSNEAGMVNFEGLLPNYQYRIHESKAPEGSLRSANDIIVQFEAQDDGSYQVKVVDSGQATFDGTSYATAEMVDGVLTWYEPQTSYSIQKLDEEGNNLSGAALEIRDTEGKVVDSWTTDGTSHEVVGKLVVGQTYTLVETQAPVGYQLAGAQNITVEDAAVDPTQTHTITVVMVDQPVVPVAPVDENSTTTTTTSAQQSTVQTSDSLMLFAGIAAIVLIVAGAVLVIALRKRNAGNGKVDRASKMARVQNAANTTNVATKTNAADEPKRGKHAR